LSGILLSGDKDKKKHYFSAKKKAPVLTSAFK